MKLALLIIDLQKAFYNEGSKASMDNASEYINYVIPWFRKKKLPILWIQHKEEEDNVIPGEKGFELIDQLKPEERDYKITKTYQNSFNKTDCFSILKNNGIDTIIITGFSAEYCVLSTYRGALDNDLLPILLKNAIASRSSENQEVVEKISNTITYSILKKMLE
jgi:nicotinamidase-related amidase